MYKRQEAEKAERDIEEATDETNSALAEYEEKRSALDEINEEIVKARMAVNLCREQKNSIDSMAVLVNCLLYTSIYADNGHHAGQ